MDHASTAPSTGGEFPHPPMEHFNSRADRPASMLDASPASLQYTLVPSVEIPEMEAPL